MSAIPAGLQHSRTLSISIFCKFRKLSKSKTTLYMINNLWQLQDDSAFFRENNISIKSNQKFHDHISNKDENEHQNKSENKLMQHKFTHVRLCACPNRTEQNLSTTWGAAVPSKIKLKTLKTELTGGTSWLTKQLIPSKLFTNFSVCCTLQSFDHEWR